MIWSFPTRRKMSLAERVEPANFRQREWRRICTRAGTGHRALKDLRDSFASWLLTAGTQLGYVSKQLGHADVAVTARHYARWVGGDFYREPMPLESGEVPADLLARIPESRPAPTTGAVAAERGKPQSSRFRGL
jgi:integrase